METALTIVQMIGAPIYMTALLLLIEAATRIATLLGLRQIPDATPRRPCRWDYENIERTDGGARSRSQARHPRRRGEI